MSVNRATMQGAFDIVEMFQKEGVPAIIAGGAARDIYFGVRPKDIDVIIAGISMATAAEILEKVGIVSVGFHIYNGAATDRLLGGYKLVGTDIDICVYDCDDVMDAVDSFDFNLNQFIISGIHHGIDGAHVRFVGARHWSTLVPVRKDYTKERHDKMQVKWLDLSYRRATGEAVEVPVGGPDGAF
ncbi:hypothetical protein [Pseudomonas weihenstephanensis]|uniref:hypothetical protein n=1 Tax=Pseudomonas weihenstephanensis TaxID=1608994 RepID=UPI00193BDB92|nr:hypothetical protein [Pseudomonas weihenstephanensis]MBM1189365.1 hypothetical protein [Pseudomonas weihenstephanensis]